MTKLTAAGIALALTLTLGCSQVNPIPPREPSTKPTTPAPGRNQPRNHNPAHQP